MRALRRLRYRLRALLQRGRLEHEMDDELRFHLALEAEKNERSGMPPPEARRAAAVSFGGLEPKKEDCRESWGVRGLETLWQDVRFAVRNLSRHSGFTAVVLVTLGLGIGANAAVFSVVRGVLLRPLPYERGDQIVVLRQSAPRAGARDLGLSPAEVLEFRERNTTLDSVVEYHTMNFTLLGGPEPQRVRTGVVSANFFDVLEVRPLLGRTFRPGEDAPGAEPVLVLSWEYWRQRQGGDPGIVGRRFTMNDRVHTVVGVLPPLPQYPDQNDVFMPASACPFRARAAENRRARMLQAFGRVKPGVPLEQARADVARVGAVLAREHRDAYPPGTEDVRATLSPLREELVQGARPTVLVLLGVVALILLIACANVANLALARINDRRREIALRASLGASRTRILRQLLTESTLLALGGGALGLLLAVATRELLVGFIGRFTPRAAEIQVDSTVLLFTLAVSVATGLVFGSLPGLPQVESLARTALNEGVRTSAGRDRARMRSALVAWQLALSFMLVIGAALMLRSFAKLQQVQAGFSTENILTLSVDLNWSTYVTPGRSFDRERTVAFHDRLQERVRAVPGVVGSAAAWTFPLNNQFDNNGTFIIEGRDPAAAAPPRAQFVGAGPDYFAVVGVPVQAGRVFEARDKPPQEGVVIVSQGLARRHFGGAEALGQRLSGDGGRTWRRIVGVVGDVRQSSLDREPPDMVYLPFLEFPGFSATLFVRTQGDPLLAAERARRAVHELDAQAAVSGIRTLEQIRHESLASPRLTTLLLGLMAGLALAISAAGISGVVAYSVSQRTQEIGIRMALGAERGRVLAMVLGQGLRPIAVGLGLGLLGALALSRLLADLLFGIQPTDPLCLSGSALVLMAVSAVACLLPARRATRIQPMLALRAE